MTPDLARFLADWLPPMKQEPETQDEAPPAPRSYNAKDARAGVEIPFQESQP